jgi:formylglycine-generating enzyme required for sulfatase activity
MRPLPATLWTATPTANFTASVEAILTQWARETATQQARNATATATLWTATATATLTPSKTNTPTLTPTLTPDPLEAALQRARAGVTTNADWDPFPHDFGDGVNMVLVPKGCFTMGSTEEQINYAINTLGAQRGRLTDEQPTTEICFDEPFWLDETEVTQADFVRLGGTQADPPDFQGDNRPVEDITWFEAQAFCEKRGGRLPTEAEWEYAARGPDELVYPWGNDWSANNAVWNRSSSQGTADVKSIEAEVSWIGAFDLSGNVWEWTLSEYKLYPYVATDGREADLYSTNVRLVLRGGSGVDNDATYFRGANRNYWTAGYIYYYFGFRCARS